MIVSLRQVKGGNEEFNASKYSFIFFDIGLVPAKSRFVQYIRYVPGIRKSADLHRSQVIAEKYMTRLNGLL